MKKETIIKLLIPVGLFCMSFTLFINPIVKVPGSITDFFKGFGVALMISALVLSKRRLSDGFGRIGRIRRK